MFFFFFFLRPPAFFFIIFTKVEGPPEYFLHEYLNMQYAKTNNRALAFKQNKTKNIQILINSYSRFKLSFFFVNT